jgi:hypothetical protein
VLPVFFLLRFSPFLVPSCHMYIILGIVPNTSVYFKKNCVCRTEENDCVGGLTVVGPVCTTGTSHMFDRRKDFIGQVCRAIGRKKKKSS